MINEVLGRTHKLVDALKLANPTLVEPIKVIMTSSTINYGKPRVSEDIAYGLKSSSRAIHMEQIISTESILAK